jgi:predicted dithiol-disulfide oxidoreductase (DUF899 family)
MNTSENSISLPNIVSDEEWQAARKGLLAKEKELTRMQAARPDSLWPAGNLGRLPGWMAADPSIPVVEAAR